MQEQILIVDDDPCTRTFLKTVLKRYGYACLTAASGSEALDRLHQEPVALVLSDLAMPGMSGLELLRQIKALDETIAVILMTAMRTTEWLLPALQAGATDYLPKPIEREILITTIEQTLNDRALAYEYTIQ